jgi:hypothetical protein
MKLKIGYVEERDSNHTKTIFFKIWAACCCEISYETAKLRKINTPKVYGPFSKAGTMILFILIDVADNDSKFTVVGYEED